jgi:hypothetical protein
MKKFDLSRVSPPVLSIALSLAVNFAVVDPIATEGMKAIAALEHSQSDAHSLLAQAHRACAANAAHSGAC